LGDDACPVDGLAFLGDLLLGELICYYFVFNYKFTLGFIQYIKHILILFRNKF